MPNGRELTCRAISKHRSRWKLIYNDGTSFELGARWPSQVQRLLCRPLLHLRTILQDTYIPLIFA